MITNYCALLAALSRCVCKCLKRFEKQNKTKQKKEWKEEEEEEDKKKKSCAD